MVVEDENCALSCYRKGTCEIRSLTAQGVNAEITSCTVDVITMIAAIRKL
jgi:hypothetical protein